MNYYEILGLKKNCSKNEIKRKYKKLAKMYHPDKGGDLEKFKQVSEAYTVLLDYNSRIKYDNNYNLESYETYVNPFDLFEEVIRKSDILILSSKINNNWLYDDLDFNDEINNSNIFSPNKNKNSCSQKFINDNKKYTKQNIRKDDKEKIFENIIDLNSIKHIPF